MKPRLVPVLLFRSLGIHAEPLNPPVLGWSCEGWIAYTALSAWVCWWYSGGPR